MAPSKLGAMSEYTAIVWLYSKGYEVFRNTSPCGDTDMIAIKAGEFIKIDVKTASLSKGKITGAWPTAVRKAKEKGITLLIVFNGTICLWGQEFVDKYRPVPSK